VTNAVIFSFNHETTATKQQQQRQQGKGGLKRSAHEV